MNESLCVPVQLIQVFIAELDISAGLRNRKARRLKMAFIHRVLLFGALSSIGIIDAMVL